MARASVDDSAWTVIKLAHVARKLGLRDLARSSLDRVASANKTLDIHDQFALAHESLMLFMPDPAAVARAQAGLRRELFHRGRDIAQGGPAAAAATAPTAALRPSAEEDAPLARGLREAAAANMQHFSEAYVAAVIRAKGAYYEARGPDFFPLAYESFACAAAQHHTSPKSWLSWALFLERLLSRLRVEAALPAAVAEAPFFAAAAAAERAAKEAAAAAAAPPPPPPPPPPPAEVATGEGAATGDAAMQDAPVAEVAAAAAAAAPPPPPPPPPSASANPVLLTARLVAKFAGVGVAPGGGGGGGGGGGMEAEAGGAGAPVEFHPDTAFPAAAALPSIVAGQAVACFMEAISLNCKLAPLQLARVFTILAGEEGASATAALHAAAGWGGAAPPAPAPAPAPGALPPASAAFLAGLGSLPTWVFLPWIPQLLGGLSRGCEAEAAKRALTALAVAYPQALYYPLRATLQDEKKGTPRYGPMSDVFTYLRRCHPPAYDMDAVVDELQARANRFSLEDEMLSIVLAQLARATLAAHGALAAGVREAAAGEGAPAAAAAAARDAEALRAHCGALSKWAAAKLAPAGASAAASRVIARYRRAFLADFGLHVEGGGAEGGGAMADGGGGGGEAPPNNPALPATLEALVARLRAWKARLLSSLVLRRLSSGSDGAAPEALSNALLGDVGPGAEIEVPGAYGSGSPLCEPQPGRRVRIAAVEPRLAPVIAAGGSAMHRRVVLLGDDGRRYAFLCSSSSAALAGADARMGQALATMGALAARHNAARGRGLPMPAWVVVPWSNRMRLTPEAPSTLNLADALDKFLEGRAAGATAGAAGAALRSGDDLLALYRAQLGGAAAARRGGGAAAVDAAYASAYGALCAAVPASALTAALRASMASVEAFEALRRAFTASTATQCLVARLLSVTERAPARLAVALSSGALLSMDPRPAFVEAKAGGGGGAPPAAGPPARLGALADDPESVPFRLTRNMAALVSLQGLAGPLAAGVVAGARGLFAQYELLLAALTLFFRDEAAAFYARAPAPLLSPALQRALREAGSGAAAEADAAPDAGSLLRRATSNALRVMDRVAELQPNTAPLPSNGEPPPRGRVHALVALATWDAANLRMPATWHAWF